MGLFQGNVKPKKTPIDENSDGVQRFFQNYFKDLRARGQKQFEKAAEKHSESFKKELDATIKKANSQLRVHIAKQLFEQFEDSDKALKSAQAESLTALNRNVQSLEKQYADLGKTLEKTVNRQSAMFTRTFEENMARMKTMQEAQEAALRSLNRNVEMLELQQQQLSAMLKNNVAKQEAVLIEVFEENMAQVIEQYLISIIGDHFDLKSQLPLIIDRMEADKKALLDDMKL
jgi:hypothetical protein